MNDNISLFNGIESAEFAKMVQGTQKKPNALALMRTVLTDPELLEELKSIMSDGLPALDTQMKIAVALSQVESVASALETQGFTYSAICSATQRIINGLNKDVAEKLGHETYPSMRNGKMANAKLLIKSDSAPAA